MTGGLAVLSERAFPGVRRVAAADPPETAPPVGTEQPPVLTLAPDPVAAAPVTAPPAVEAAPVPTQAAQPVVTAPATTAAPAPIAPPTVAPTVPTTVAHKTHHPAAVVVSGGS